MKKQPKYQTVLPEYWDDKVTKKSTDNAFTGHAPEMPQWSGKPSKTTPAKGKLLDSNGRATVSLERGPTCFYGKAGA